MTLGLEVLQIIVLACNIAGADSEALQNKCHRHYMTCVEEHYKRKSKPLGNYGVENALEACLFKGRVRL